MLTIFIFNSDTMIETVEVVKLIDAIPKAQPKALSLKRKLEEDEEEAEAERAKKTKATHTVVDDVVILDESDDEDIVLLDD
jgi:hypothetical protein